jgi:hypothetical protein
MRTSVGVHIILEALDEKGYRTGTYSYYPKKLFELSHRDAMNRNGYILQPGDGGEWVDKVKCIEVGVRTITVEDTFNSPWEPVLGGFDAHIDDLIRDGLLTPSGWVALPNGQEMSTRVAPWGEHVGKDGRVDFASAVINGVEYKIRYKDR